MKLEYYLYKKNIKRVILLLIVFVIISLYTSKTFASTIEDSNISINIDNNGVCQIDERIEITGIDEGEANLYDYPSMELTRGDDITDLRINNLSVYDYYKNWKSNQINSTYYEGKENPFSSSSEAVVVENSSNIYKSPYNLFFSGSRKVSIFIILY